MGGNLRIRGFPLLLTPFAAAAREGTKFPESAVLPVAEKRGAWYNEGTTFG